MARGCLAAVAAAVLAWGCGGDSAGPSRPAPNAMAAAFQEDGTVLVTWQLDQGPFEELVLEARIGSGIWQPVFRLEVDSTGVVLTPLFQPTELQPLSFRINAKRDGLHGYSPEASALAPPRAPIFLQVTGTAAPTLTWTNTSRVSTTAEVSRRELALDGRTGDWTTTTLAPGVTTYEDQWPGAGLALNYRVRYLAAGVAGTASVLTSPFQPIPVDAPVIEVVEGVGLRATTGLVGNVSAGMLLYEASGSSQQPLVAGVMTLDRWPPSPVLGMAVSGTINGAAGAAPIDGAMAWVPPFTIPGPRPLRASGPSLPRQGTLVRSLDGRFHAFDGHRLWVGEPGTFESHQFASGPVDSCLPLSSTDALGRTHLVYRAPSASAPGVPGPPVSDLVHAQHDATGWHATGITTFHGTSNCAFQARTAADGTVHVLLLSTAGQTRWLVGVAGSFTEERVLPGAPVSLAVAPDGTAYAMTSAAFGVRDVLGGWTDLVPPDGWQGVDTVLLAADGGRLAALHNVSSATGNRVAWRELGAGGWGAEEAVGSLTGFDARPEAQVAALGDDGDQAVVGGTGASGPVVMERRGGAWQPVAVPSLTQVRSLGLTGGRLWVAGQQQYLAPGLLTFPEFVRTALYEEP